MPVLTFTRGSERLRCEHIENRTGFALVLSTPGGGSIVQRFTDAASMVKRRMVLEHALVSSGWLLDGVVETAARS